jgi:N-acetylneuraminic acid mutarotase
MPAMLARRSYPACVVAGCQAVICGGSADGRVLNTIEAFDTDQESWDMWFTMPPMQMKRTLFGAVVGDGKLVVCGGFDGIRDLTSVEMYDFEGSSWHRLPSLDSGRSYLALVSDNRYIYAIGGQERTRDNGPRAFQQVDLLDMQSEVWLPGVPMLNNRLGHAAALLEQGGSKFIYVCGGSDGLDTLNTMERFNISEQIWENLPPMGVPRLGHAAAVVRGRLYVIGGYDGQEVLDTFECFDPASGCWGPILPMGASEAFHLPPGHREILDAQVEKAS